MKIIIAGYPKTGTKSVNAALTQLGYSVYDALENLVLLQDDYIKILHHGWSTEDFFRMYENVDTIADMPACFFWDEIHKAFPDAKIILTLREDEDAWWRSVMNQIKAADGVVPRMMEILSPTFNRARKKIWSFAMILMFGNQSRHPLALRSTKLNEQMARKCYRSHNAYVMQAAPKDKLLVFKCSEGWKPLCEFLEREIPDNPFPRKNVRGNVVNELKDHPIVKQAQREILFSIAKLAFATGVITYCSCKYGPVKIVQAACSQMNKLIHTFWPS